MEPNELFFRVTQLIAESDSIGEGYHYCPTYTREMHNAPGDWGPEPWGEPGRYKKLAKEIIDLIQGTPTDEMGEKREMENATKNAPICCPFCLTTHMRYGENPDGSITCPSCEFVFIHNPIDEQIVSHMIHNMTELRFLIVTLKNGRDITLTYPKEMDNPCRINREHWRNGLRSWMSQIDPDNSSRNSRTSNLWHSMTRLGSKHGS